MGILWNAQEEKILLDNYLIKNKNEMEILLPNRKYCNIMQHARKLGIIRRNKRWDSASIKFLKNNYENSEKENMLKYLNRSWDAIKIKAEKLKLKRNEKCYVQRCADLTNMLNDSYETLYWMGFFLADGHIDTETKRFGIGISKKDNNHLEKFAKYVSTEIKYDKRTCYVSCQNKKIVGEIIKKYDVNSRKTYIPPNFNKYNFTNEQWFSLICGYIDGDGSISCQYKREHHSLITIKCHSSWFENIFFFENKIYEIFDKHPHKKILTKINNCGYACVFFTNSELNSDMKKLAIKLKLPIMHRKWKNINENFKSRYGICKQNREIIHKLYYDDKKTMTEISKILNYSYAGVYQILHK
jgi:hypothetical protein